MTQLLLIRHAETKFNAEKRYNGLIDEPLNAVGIKQSELLAQRLKSHKIQVLYSSPQKRAYDTAEKVGQTLKLKVHTSESLREINFGPWEGLTQNEIVKKWPKEWKLWREDPARISYPIKETLREVQERVVPEISKLLKNHTDQTIAIVSHEAVLRVFTAYCLGVELSIYRRLKFHNASLSIISHNTEGFKILLLNDTCHLNH